MSYRYAICLEYEYVFVLNQRALHIFINEKNNLEWITSKYIEMA